MELILKNESEKTNKFLLMLILISTVMYGLFMLNNNQTKKTQTINQSYYQNMTINSTDTIYPLH